MATLQMAPALSRYTGNSTAVELPGSNLHEVLTNLTDQFDLGSAVLAPSGSLQPYVRVVVDDQILTTRSPEELQDVAVAGRRLELRMAMAGG